MSGVMEEKLGRSLSAEEVVHHVNHNKNDFSPANLELKPNQSVHMKEHWAEGSIRSTLEQAIARGRASDEVRKAKMLRRQETVAELTSRGLTTEQIAAALAVCPATVRRLRRLSPHCLPIEQQPSLFARIA